MRGDRGEFLSLFVGLLLSLWVVPVAVADEQSTLSRPAIDKARLAVEDVYFQLMLDWARGSRTAVAELSDLQQRLAEHEAGFTIDLNTYALLPTKPRVKRLSTATDRALPGLACLREIQSFTHTRFAGTDPDTLMPLADLNRRLYLEQVRPDAFRPWLAEHSEARAFWLIEFFRKLAEPDVDRERQVVGMLIAMGDALANASLEEAEVKARRVFGRALQFDRDNLAARYWAAFLAERGGKYQAAVKHLEVLVELAPDDVEAALRLAIGRVRGGRDAAAALESIARGEGADWLRILAYQQLGHWLAAQDSPRAVALVREGSRRFPNNARLHLQLSYLEREDWDAALVGVRRVETDWRGDAGTSPRVRYCGPRRDEIDAEKLRLEQALAPGKEVLVRNLERILKRSQGLRPRFDSCPDAWSVPEPPGDSP